MESKDSEIQFPEIKSSVLEKVIQYMYYKVPLLLGPPCIHFSIRMWFNGKVHLSSQNVTDT